MKPSGVRRGRPLLQSSARSCISGSNITSAPAESPIIWGGSIRSPSPARPCTGCSATTAWAGYPPIRNSAPGGSAGSDTRSRSPGIVCRAISPKLFDFFEALLADPTFWEEKGLLALHLLGATPGKRSDRCPSRSVPPRSCRVNHSVSSRYRFTKSLPRLQPLCIANRPARAHRDTRLEVKRCE